AVNLATERARIETEEAPDIPALLHAVEQVGYAVGETSTEFAIDGMTCASCVGRVEKALTRVPGVLSASVNLATEKAMVRHLAAGAVSAGDLLEAVQRAGYAARVAVGAADSSDADAQRREQERRELQRAVMWAGALTLPIIVLEMGAHLVPA